MADPAVKLTKAQREAPTSPSDPRLLQRENDRRAHELMTDVTPLGLYLFRRAVEIECFRAERAALASEHKP